MSDELGRQVLTALLVSVAASIVSRWLINNVPSIARLTDPPATTPLM